MNRSSFFIENKALFGTYPTDEDATYYESIGVKYFIDLTLEGEVRPYKHNSKYIKYPINDMNVPSQPMKFATFVIYLTNLITNFTDDEKLFISCRGGHGRAGILVACILSKYHNLSPQDALQLTNKYHSNRVEMKHRWRVLGSPQTQKQKNFVLKLFSPFCFSRNMRVGDKVGFNFHSDHPITYNDEIWNNAYELFEHIILNEGINVTNDHQRCITIMNDIIKLKCIQHNDFLYNLLSTTLRPIIYCNVNDGFWGYKNEGDKNSLGKILSIVRDEYFLKNYQEILIN